MVPVHVVTERLEDVEAVDALEREAFGARGDAVASLVDELRGTADPISLTAVVDDVPVGHVMATACWIDASRRLVDALVLSPLAVRPAHRGQGIGAALVRAVLAAADRLGAPAVLLEGHPDYYGPLGFVSGEEAGIRRPSLRIPPSAMQIARLSRYERWMTGTLVYPDLWWHRDLVGLRGAGE